MKQLSNYIFLKRNALNKNSNSKYLLHTYAYLK